MITEEMMSFSEAADYLGYTRSYTYKLMHFRKIEYLRYGKKAFFLKSACDEYIKNHVTKFNAEKSATI